MRCARFDSVVGRKYYEWRRFFKNSIGIDRGGKMFDCRRRGLSLVRIIDIYRVLLVLEKSLL